LPDIAVDVGVELNYVIVGSPEFVVDSTLANLYLSERSTIVNPGRNLTIFIDVPFCWY
jgi:hypothetical protein